MFAQDTVGLAARKFQSVNIARIRTHPCTIKQPKPDMVVESRRSCVGRGSILAGILCELLIGRQNPVAPASDGINSSITSRARVSH